MLRLPILCLTITAFLCGQSISGISGTVVDSVTGVPLSKAQVSVDGTGLSATTDSEGHFKLNDLAPGQYSLRGKRNGYLEGVRQITLEAGEDAKDVKLPMARFGVIAGTVRDTDGEPMAGVSVSAAKTAYTGRGQRRLSATDFADTDDLGQFRITGLEPGRYTVGVVEDSGPARPVELQTGQRVEGIDLTLTHPGTVRVSGHVARPAGMNQPYVSLSAGEGGYSTHAEVKPNGDFEFAKVPAGAYTLRAYASLPGKPTTDLRELTMNMMTFASKMPLAVGTEPIKGLTITIEPGVEVTGHVNVKATGARVQFQNEEEEVDAIVHDDQTFSTALPQGHFYIDHHMLRDYVVSGVLLDGRDILDEGLTVSGPGKVSLEIVLTKDGGRVEGVVSDQDGKPLPGATVVLVPELSRRSHPDLFQDVEADQLGRYRIDNIPPGEYKLLAWAEVEYGLWWDPDFLRGFENKGEPVSIKAGSRETRPLTSAAARQ